MSFGVSQSSNPQSTTNQQYTVSGGSGTGATILAGGSVNVTDAGQTAHAIDAVTQFALQGLGLLADSNAKNEASMVTSELNDNNLLSSVLADNQVLAQNVQSGGATVGMDLTTKVVIGAMAVLGLVVAVLLSRK